MKIKAVIAAVVLAALSLTGCSAPSEKGLEYLQEEEYDKAIEEFQKAVDKDDNPGDAYRGSESPNGSRRTMKVRWRHLRAHWKMVPKRRALFTISSDAVRFG